VEPIAFQVGEDVLSAIVGVLPAIVAIILLVGGMMWFLAWMSRYFAYLKSLESRWLDPETLDFVHRVLEGIWIVFMALIVLVIAQSRVEPLHDALVAFVHRVPALFFAVFVVFAAAIMVRVLHRFASYLRGELKVKPKRVAPPRALAFTEIVLKYLIYVGALIVALFGGIRILPAGDQAYLAAFASFPATPEPPVVLAILIAILIVFLADRFVDSIFEDLKRRSTKFSTRVLDEFKAFSRYAVWLIGASILLFVLLDLLLSQERLVIFAVGFVASTIVIAMVVFDPIRNALAGVTLMRADAFDVGDRVKIGNELVCDVVAMSLTLTQVRTLRGERVSIPNTQLLQQPILNFTRSKPYAIVVEITIGFDVGHDRVHALLLQAARETEGILTTPPPEAYGKDVQGDAILYQLLAYTDRPERMKDVRSALICKMQDVFGTAGVKPAGAVRAP